MRSNTTLALQLMKQNFNSTLSDENNLFTDLYSRRDY